MSASRAVQSRAWFRSFDHVRQSRACFIIIASILGCELCRACNDALVISWILVAGGKKTS